MDATSSKNAVILATGSGTFLPRSHIPALHRCVPQITVSGLRRGLAKLEAVGVSKVTIVADKRLDQVHAAVGSTVDRIAVSRITLSAPNGFGHCHGLWLARDALENGDCYILDESVLQTGQTLSLVPAFDAVDAVAADRPDRGGKGLAAFVAKDGRIVGFRNEWASKLNNPPYKLFEIKGLLHLSEASIRSVFVPALANIIGSGAMGASLGALLAYLVERRGLCLSIVTKPSSRRTSAKGPAAENSGHTLLEACLRGTENMQ